MQCLVPQLWLAGSTNMRHWSNTGLSAGPDHGRLVSAGQCSGSCRRETRCHRGLIGHGRRDGRKGGQKQDELKVVKGAPGVRNVLCHPCFLDAIVGNNVCVRIALMFDEITYKVRFIYGRKMWRQVVSFHQFCIAQRKFRGRVMRGDSSL